MDKFNMILEEKPEEAVSGKGEAPATSNEGDHSEYGPPAESQEEAQRSISYLMTLLVAPVLNGFQEAQRQVGGEDEETELHHNKKIKLTAEEEALEEQPQEADEVREEQAQEVEIKVEIKVEKVEINVEKVEKAQDEQAEEVREEQAQDVEIKVEKVEAAQELEKAQEVEKAEEAQEEQA